MFSFLSPVAQLVERVTVNHHVPGSSPGRGAILYDRKNLSSEGFFLFWRGHGAVVFDLRVGMVKANTLNERAEKALLFHQEPLHSAFQSRFLGQHLIAERSQFS